jgi:DNA-directed RNA polymerase subunit F
MIENSKALSMSESVEYVQGEDHQEIRGFMGKFVKLSLEDSKALRETLEKLDLMKLRANHISKIIDLLPESKEELNKIVTDVSLEEDEVTKILDAIKQYK